MGEREKRLNQDPVSGSFGHEDINPEMFGGKLRGAKPNITRRDALKLFGLGTLALAGCTPKGQAVIKTVEAFTPDPTAVAERVEELRQGKETEEQTPIEDPILNTPETGTYNPEALKRWQELEPQPKIDERIDIAILPSRYVRGVDAFSWHLDVAKKLGFQAVSVVASPPEFKNHTGIDLPSGITLDELIQRSDYDRIFSDPDLKRVHLTCDVGGSGAVNGWQFPRAGVCTPEGLERTYQEYYRTAEILLTKYGASGKEIIIGGPNEIDLLAKGGYSAGTEDADWQAAARENAITYFNTIYKAVRDANAAHPDKNPLKTGLEILQFRSLWDSKNAVNALSGVVPNLEIQPGEVSLSAWQVAGKGKEGYLLGAATKLIEEFAPKSDVAISEFGVADGDRPELTRDQIAKEYINGINAALSQGAKRVTIWGLTGFNSDNDFPNNNEERGLGLIRPDGSLRKEVYAALQQFSNS